MDPSAFKKFKTSRGITYNYFYSAPADGKPTLLCLHGFPSISYDYRHVVAYFKPLGYGFIIPDLLGYGGTDKPTDPELYRMKLMVTDVIEILDEEKAEKIISIGHDWGSGLNSRIANYHPERFVAFAYLAAGYLPPMPDFNIDAINAASVEKYGYPNFGYWYFFETDGAAKIMEEHIDSLMHLGFADDYSLMSKHFCPVGGLEAWLKADRKDTKFASWTTPEEVEMAKQVILAGGYAAPLCWYKAYMRGYTPKDDAEIPKERYTTNKPVFFAATLHDAACLAEENKVIIKQTCPNATIVEFDTGHWVLSEATEKCNKELQKWFEGLQF